MPVKPLSPSSIDATYTANRAVNAVPHVCAAPPGIRSTLDLPQIVTTLA